MRKIKWSIRREIKMGVALIGLSFLIAFSERKQEGVLCKGIIVEMENIHDNYFLDEADILELVDGDQKLKGMGLDRISFRDVEEKLKYDRHIKDAELYCDLKGNLIVTVEMRRPIARIVQEDGPDAYISEEGVVMSVSDKFTSRVLIISGRFVKQFLQAGDLMKLEEGRQLMSMLSFIRNDAFWNAQVAQVDINSKGELLIYPQVTGQLVEFGTTEHYEAKLKKLKVFYKEVLPQKGWTKYEKVNLKFEGQVIAE